MTLHVSLTPAQTTEALVSFWSLVQYGDACAGLLPRPGLEALTLRELTAYSQAVCACGVRRYYGGDLTTEQVFNKVEALLDGRKFEPGSLLATWYETVETDDIGIHHLLEGDGDRPLSVTTLWHRCLGLRLIASRTSNTKDAAEIMREAMALEADLLTAAT